MSGIINEHDRQELLAFLNQADNDTETTGLFVYMLAPRRSGLDREAVLTTGELPVEAVMERMRKTVRARLTDHNKARG